MSLAIIDEAGYANSKAGRITFNICSIHSIPIQFKTAYSQA